MLYEVITEVPRHLDADRVRANIVLARVAAAVAEKAGAGLQAAGLERAAEHVSYNFV